VSAQNGAVTEFYANPSARHYRTERAAPDAREFHRGIAGYAPTRLVELPSIATELGVAHVVVKEESSRFGLPAFKGLGASHAIARAMAQKPATAIIAATDGNHGRAVAHFAALAGVPVRVFVPDTITVAAREAIASEGAKVTVFTVPYDEVVLAAAAEAEASGALLVQDSEWPGYTQIPEWIVEGYSTLFFEADQQLQDAGLPAATLVTVPSGVGALAQAAVEHYRAASGGPVILIVEPDTAPCILESLRVGERVAVPTDHTIMNGLNCGVVSPGAWPAMRDGADAAITVTDDEARTAVRDLQALGVDSGPCGASSLAAVRAMPRELLSATDTLLLLSTEALAANPIEL
jgi:diaminopropionate ammonia-lyase